MDLSKAGMHDLHYLNDVQANGINNCNLIGDAGYLSSEMQIALFSSSNVVLKTPKCSNQKDFKLFDPVFRKSRKRVETVFYQLCD